MQIMPACQDCAFFEVIPLPSGHKRALCHLTGEKNPNPAMLGCQFLAGSWNDLDQILGLTGKRNSSKNGLPNTTKPGNGFSGKSGLKVAKKDIFAIGENRFSEFHIAARQEGNLVRPGTREGPVARSARERTGLPFLF